MSGSLEKVENIFFREVVGERCDHSDTDGYGSSNITLDTLGMVTRRGRDKGTTNGAERRP